LSGGATPVSAVQGTLNVDRSRGRSNFLLGYTGGAVFYHRYSSLNDNFHDLGLSETYLWHRWSLVLADQFDFVPSATAGSFGSPTIPLGIGLPSGLQGTDVTGTSVAMRATRITNTAVVELSHTLSPQSSVTFGGSFGILRFMDSGFVNTNQGGFRAGYDRRLSRRDTIAMSYGYDVASYPEANARMNGHTLELSYARQLTGRFLIQVSAGPHYSQYTDNEASASELFVDGRIALKARIAKTDLSLSAARETNGGSGAMLGAKQNVAALSIARTFPRIFAFEVGGGIARNTGLQSNLKFNSTYAGGTITHYIGRHASMFFIYNMQRQTGSRDVITINKVPVDLNRNVYGIGISWSFKPRTVLER
jgi:hypothetical protein